MWLFLLLATFSLSHSGGASEEDLPRIAIIGAGIGGTSTAYYLRQLFSDQATIDIYEANHVGGRLATLTIDGEDIESGGSTIHPKNAYMVNFTKLLGLEIKDLNSDGFGIYDGNQFQFQSSSYTFLTALKALWRYGTDIQRISNWVDNTLLTKFSRIYDHQKNGYAFTTVKDLLLSMDQLILNLTTKPLVAVLKEDGFSECFISELVTVAVRTNYGQTTGIHALVGAISLAGMQPGLWAVKGGNKMVAEGLLQKSKANLVQAEVKKISLIKEHDSIQYELDYLLSSPNVEKYVQSSIYDIVIVAMPLNQNTTNIEFEGFTSGPLTYKQPFQRTVTTFIQGQVNASFFNYESENDLPSNIMINKEPYFINSIAKKSKSKNIWKIFSRKILTDIEKNLLFKTINWTTVYDWLAYPAYSSSQQLLPFVLHDQFYYVNAIESAASSIEMSIVGAKNVALLALNHWHNLFDYIDEIPNESEPNKINKEL